jgi:hypothetical protein
MCWAEHRITLLTTTTAICCLSHRRRNHLQVTKQVLHFMVFYFPVTTRNVRKVKIQRSWTCATFLIYKSHTVNELAVHKFIFQHIRWHCPNNYKVLEPASVSPSHRSLRFEPRHDFLHLIIVVELFPSEIFLKVKKQVEIITLPQTTTIFLWISAGRSPFALRNRMTERTSYLAGLWICAAIQTSLTQTKPVLPLSNEHGSQVKDQGRWQCFHNKHKKFPYRPTRDVSLLSRQTL